MSKPTNVSRKTSPGPGPAKPSSSPDLESDSPEKKTSGTRLAIRFGIFGFVLILVIVTVTFFSSRLSSKPTYQGGKVVGKIVPDVTVTTLDGEEIEMRSLVGKRVIVNFFNSWCIPCQEEEPALQEFAREHEGDPDFVFIGIARDDSPANIRNWASSREVPFEVTLDDNESASIAFGTTGQPETYAINSEGLVVASLLARASTESLNEMWDATR